MPVREQKIKRKKSKKLKIPLAFFCKRCYTEQAVKRNASFRYAAVAQLDRVTGYEPVGRGFESLQPYQLVASVVSLATSFFHKSLPCAHAAVPRFRPANACAGLQFDETGCPSGRILL